MQFPHSKEETSALVKLAGLAYSVMKDGESLQINLPLSSIVGLNGQQSMGTLIIIKPAMALMIQGRNAPSSSIENE